MLTCHRKQLEILHFFFQLWHHTQTIKSLTVIKISWVTVEILRYEEYRNQVSLFTLWTAHGHTLKTKDKHMISVPTTHAKKLHLSWKILTLFL